MKVPASMGGEAEEAGEEKTGISEGIRTLTAQLLPNWDTSDWPQEREGFLQRLSQCAKLTQAKLNEWLIASDLSATTGTSKRQKIDQLVNKIESA